MMRVHLIFCVKDVCKAWLSMKKRPAWAATPRYAIDMPEFTSSRKPKLHGSWYSESTGFTEFFFNYPYARSTPFSLPLLSTGQLDSRATYCGIMAS